MLRERARSAAILAPPILVALLLGGPWIALVVGIAVALGAFEAFRLLTSAGHASFPALGVVLAVVIALADSVRQLPDGSGLILAGIGIVLVGSVAITRPDPREGLATLITTTFGALYVGLLGFVPRLAALDAPVVDGSPLGFLGGERAWVLILLLTVWTFDTAAYGVGRRFGSRHFIPHISPGKTVEGVVGGTVGAIVVCTLLVLAVGRPPIAGFFLGLVIAGSAQVGDLAESMLKRAAGAKESGRLIPGHGGLLDRIDSFLFAAPVAFLYVVLFLG
ncbi:MAG TPA: phosphatidate cytidylyltransferase [Candidatus Limnocylindrales bacterium]|nr:phosphatidate cytidylyltransferase [Candidatus Limnocylindrales bacterium]